MIPPLLVVLISVGISSFLPITVIPQPTSTRGWIKRVFYQPIAQWSQVSLVSNGPKPTRSGAAEFPFADDRSCFVLDNTKLVVGIANIIEPRATCLSWDADIDPNWAHCLHPYMQPSPQSWRVRSRLQGSIQPIATQMRVAQCQTVSTVSLCDHLVNSERTNISTPQAQKGRRNRDPLHDSHYTRPTRNP
ncbi:hypothetical protein F5B21DRAFT_249243 [Xylaria acuta]|nr:hypothetical protein F5B21DRAFT_249243 [Xylaria acuta]